MAASKLPVFVLDAGPLISFACADALGALAAWAEGASVRWPEAVRDEVKRKSKQPGYEAVKEAVDPDWLPKPDVLGSEDDLRAIEEIRYRLASREDSQAAHAGEASAIRLAVNLERQGTPTLLTGDRDAGVVAKESFGIRRLMTRDLLVGLVAKKYLTVNEAWTAYQRMQQVSRLPDMDRRQFITLCQGALKATQSK